MEDARAEGIEQRREMGTGAGELELKAVTDIFSRLAIACKSRSLYPEDHPAARESVQILFHIMADSLSQMPSVNIQVLKDSLVFDKWSIGQDRESLRQLASRIRSLKIQEITLMTGLTPVDVGALVELLVHDPEEMDAEGGPEAFLLAKGAAHISVIESAARRVDASKGVSEGGAEELEAGSAEEDQEPEFSLEGVDLLELLLHPEELAQALLLLGESESGRLENAEHASEIFQFLKEAADLIERNCRGFEHRYHRSEAEALLFLEVGLRNTLLLDQLIAKLGEEPTCINILGQYNPQEIADLLSYFIPVSLDFLPRARDVLKTIGFKAEEIEKAVELLKDRLIDLGEVPPALLTSLDEGPAKAGADIPASPRLPTLEEISLTFIDYLPEEIEEIQHISELDITLETPADTTPMLLDFLAQASKLDNLNKAVEMLAKNFWHFAGSAQLGQAANILERVAAMLAKHDPTVDVLQSDLARLFDEASNGRVVHRIVQLAYAERNDPKAEENLKRYLYLLGDRSIAGLVEALGVEEDMSVRKFIIDILSELGKQHMQVLGIYVNDPRWYLVRNMVTVMARLHSIDALPYLRRTLNHPNEKVRAETVRALGLIGGQDAGDILIQGLESMDEQMRLLCIRWLGRLEDARAVGALVNMLEDKNPGAESLEMKKEIIITLGEIKAPNTYGVLKKYRSKQKLLNRSGWQEINAEAQEAVARLVEKYPYLEGKK